jgi:hypothetical protein
VTIVSPTTGNPLFTCTTTAQEIMNAVAQDVRQTVSATDTTTPGPTTLLDFTNRVSKEMLQTSRWMFTLAPPQAFVTQLGVTDYWIGPTGQAPAGVYDTGLNLTDFRIIKPKSVKDRSNFRTLGHMDESPIYSRLSYPDKSFRLGLPRVWRQDPQSPNILSVYPAPDNQNNYNPQPEPPILGTVAGGALPARIYFVTVTFVDSLGNESTAPYAQQIYIPAGFLLQVFPPKEPQVTNSAGIQYNQYNVYAANAGTNEQNVIYYQNTTQQATNISTNYPWFEPTSGLTATGGNPPGTNGVAPINGYIIEFRYYRQRAQLTDPNQVLQIPDDYTPCLIAGVDAMTFHYLTRPQEAMQKYQIYRDGLSQIIRDLNFITKGGDYIGADDATQAAFSPGVETLDISVLIP